MQIFKVYTNLMVISLYILEELGYVKRYKGNLKQNLIIYALQSILWGMGVEAYWWQIRTATLSEQGRSWKEN